MFYPYPITFKNICSTFSLKSDEKLYYLCKLSGIYGINDCPINARATRQIARPVSTLRSYTDSARGKPKTPFISLFQPATSKQPTKPYRPPFIMKKKKKTGIHEHDLLGEKRAYAVSDPLKHLEKLR